MIKHFLSTIIIVILTSSSSYAQGLDLMTLKDWEIVVDEESIPSEKFAAEEFQNLFHKATGIDLEIVNKPKSKSKNIFIGLLKYPGDTSYLLDVDALGKEGLRIIINQDNIIIEGGRPRGALYAVYEFAERYLGIRFLTNEYTYMPSQKSNLVIPLEEFFYKPCFDYRNVYYKENMINPEFSVRLRLNAFEKREKYGGRSDMEFVNHSFYYQLPVDSFGEEHPEYFAEVEGERLLKVHGGGPQLCVSNPDVKNILTEAVLKEITDNQGNINVSLSQNDNKYYCTCENCESINKREGSPMGSHLAMINQVANDVSRIYPDAIIGTLAYQYSRKPPKKIVPEDNVMIQLCNIECDMLHAYHGKSAKVNKPFAKDLTKWSKITGNLWIWDYIVNFRCYGLPVPNLKSIGEKITFYSEKSIKGVFMQANYSGLSGEMSDLRNYVTSRCLWNPGLDSWELTKEFCNLYYLNSAKPILEYLTLIHNNVEQKKLNARCIGSKPTDFGLDWNFANYIFEKFQEALAMADNEIIRNRVEKASICAYVAVIETFAHDINEPDKQRGDRNEEKYNSIVNRFIELAKKFDMRYYNESTLVKNKKF